VINLHAKFEVSSFNRSRDIEGSKNSKSKSRNPFTTLFDLIFIFFVRTPRAQSACRIWSFWLQLYPRYRKCPKILKVGHVTHLRPVNTGSPVTPYLDSRPQFAYTTFMGLRLRLNVVYMEYRNC